MNLMYEHKLMTISQTADFLHVSYYPLWGEVQVELARGNSKGIQIHKRGAHQTSYRLPRSFVLELQEKLRQLYYFEKNFLTVKDVAEKMHYNLDFVYRAIRSGELRATMFKPVFSGGNAKFYISYEDFEAFLIRRQEEI